MKYLLVVFVAVAAAIARAEPIATNLTLETAVAVALADNRDLAAARLVVREAEGRLKQAGLLPNPEFELSQESDRAFGDEGESDFSSGFKQRIPITRRLAKARAVAQIDVAMAAAEVRDQERLLVGEVLGSSRDLLVTQQRMEVNQDIQTNVQRLIETSEKLLRVAEGAPADVNLAKLEMQKLVLAAARLLNQKASATTRLNQMLGRDPTFPLQILGTIEASLDTNAVTEISRQAHAHRPDRQGAALGVDRSVSNIRLAGAEVWEDWTIGLDYSRSVEKFDAPIGTKTDDLLGFGVSIPLPLWNRNQGRIAETRSTRQRLEAELVALDVRIEAEVQAAEGRMRRLADILNQQLDEGINLANANIGLMQKGYAEGLVDITANIQAQQQLAELRQAYLDVLEEFLRAKTEWETATGAMLSDE